MPKKNCDRPRHIVWKDCGRPMLGVKKPLVDLWVHFTSVLDHVIKVDKLTPPRLIGLLIWSAPSTSVGAFKNLQQ